MVPIIGLTSPSATNFEIPLLRTFLTNQKIRGDKRVSLSDTPTTFEVAMKGFIHHYRNMGIGKDNVDPN